jgi:NAD(P)-dependent dehydrogenase (short-subunit alcohol dehydrogenase family)
MELTPKLAGSIPSSCVERAAPDAATSGNGSNAAKFAVRGFTESLRQEMIAARKPVTVTCVHPGGIKTGEKPNHAKQIRRYLANTAEPTSTSRRGASNNRGV